MQTKTLRVVHYINQFFGGIGGEDKAYIRPQVKNGSIGPGKAIQQVLGERGEVVATVICGDNYFAERIEEVAEEVIELLIPYRPDALIAGPAFDAGRYGIACGALCKAVQSKLDIPSVTGMYDENPGVDLFKKYVYIVKTESSAKGMVEVVSRMVSILCRLASDQKIGRPSEEGYFPRGFLGNETSDRTSAERAISMLLAKIEGQRFESEALLPKYDRVIPAPGVKDLSSTTIALVTDGGLVPKGNPDRIEVKGATRFGAYSIKEIRTLNPEDYEVTHLGYDGFFVAQDPHRLVPVDVMRDLEKEGIIGKLHDTFYATTGVATSVENAKRMGRAIAERLKREGVSGVILTST